MNRCYDSDHEYRYAYECHRQVEDGKITHKVRKWLAQGTCQIELLAAVMDDMVIPKEIDHMLDPVYPISCQIYADEAKEIHPYRCSIPMEQVDVFNQKPIRNDGYTEPQSSFENIDHT
jgi:hypothetical protein